MSDLAEPIPGIKPAPHRTLWIGYTLYLSGSLAFALNGTVSKAILLSGLDSARLSQLRVTGAFLFLLAFVAINRPHRLKIERREWIPLIAYGVLGVAMTQNKEANPKPHIVKETASRGFSTRICRSVIR